MNTYYDAITGTDVPACTESHLFSAACAYCTADALKIKTYDEVMSWWVQGVIGDDAIDAYRYVWATSAPRHAAYDHLMTLPDTDGARRIATVLRALVPSGRGYC